MQKQPHHIFDITVTLIGLSVSVPTSPLEREHNEDPVYNEDVDNEVSFLEMKDLVAWSHSLPDDIWLAFYVLNNSES